MDAGVERLRERHRDHGGSRLSDGRCKTAARPTRSAVSARKSPASISCYSKGASKGQIVDSRPASGQVHDEVHHVRLQDSRRSTARRCLASRRRRDVGDEDRQLCRSFGVAACPRAALRQQLPPEVGLDGLAHVPVPRLPSAERLQANFSPVPLGSTQIRGDDFRRHRHGDTTMPPAFTRSPWAQARLNGQNRRVPRAACLGLSGAPTRPQIPMHPEDQ